MSVDSEVKLIADAAAAAAVAPLDARVNTQGQAIDMTQAAQALTQAAVADLQKRVLALETATPAPPPVVTPPPTPPTGVPVIPQVPGALLRKSFAETPTLTPFRALTYPNSHPGDAMIQYGKFVTDAAHISIHDGYLDLRCTRNPDGSWSQSFVGTGLDGNGGTTNALFKFTYGKVRWWARMNAGVGAWQGLWLLVADAWTSPEIDWPEQIGQRFTANLHGSSSNGQKASVAMDGNWHEFAVDKRAAATTFYLDGKQVGSSVGLTANMGLLADAKVGLTAPTAATPDLFLQIAGLVVEP